MSEARTLEELVQVLRGYQESRILLSAVELDVFGALLRSGEEAGAPRVAAETGTDARAMEMLLNALVALGALEKKDGRFRCTPASRTLAESRPGLMHMVRKWDSWSTLTTAVRSGTQAQGPDRVRDAEGIEAFIEAMRSRAFPAAARLVRVVGTTGVRRMLDIGGGPATFAIAFAQAEPSLQAEVLDLAEVVPIAQRHIEAVGLTERVHARPGDLRTDPLGRDYDLILVSAICHMLSETENQDLFRRCAAALSPKGRLVVRDFFLEEDRTRPKMAALFALNMLTATNRGNVYTEREYRTWLSDAGLPVVLRPEDGDEGLLIASRA